MFRACRLVVDTGIHTMGWTFEQSTELLKNNTSITDGDIATEVKRYITWPGQACSYTIGKMKIQEQRDKAAKQLGNNFDVKEFHDTVLRCGFMHLHGLEQIIAGYINNKIKST